MERNTSLGSPEYPDFKALPQLIEVSSQVRLVDRDNESCVYSSSENNPYDERIFLTFSGASSQECTIYLQDMDIHDFVNYRVSDADLVDCPVKVRFKPIHLDDGKECLVKREITGKFKDDLLELSLLDEKGIVEYSIKIKTYIVVAMMDIMCRMYSGIIRLVDKIDDDYMIIGT